MMEVVADLVRRGIISPDAAQSFAQKLVDRASQNQGQVDDRRSDRPSGYLAMQAGNQMVRMITRYLLGLELQGGEKGAYDVLPGPERPPGKLEKDAGIEDIGKHLARHYYQMAPENGEAPEWGYDSKAFPTWNKTAP